MATRTKPDELTWEEFLRNAANGVLDDRVEAFMPPGMYGPQTAEARLASRRNGTGRATRTSRKAPNSTSLEGHTKAGDAAKPG